MNPRIGFACKWVDDESPEAVEVTSFKRTTVAWCKQNPSQTVRRIEELVEQNCNALDALIGNVAALVPERRMCRLTSDLLPLFTHAVGTGFYSSQENLEYIQKRFQVAGAVAKAAGVRLSFHPGQFTVLNSPDPGLVNRSIEEVEMHTQQAGWLGYTRWHEEGFCINIHAGGKAGGLDSLKTAIARLSTEAQNLLTIENDEFSWKTQDLADANLPVPIVVDVHHHWIHTGKYLLPESELWARVIEGWKGVRPKIHCAMSNVEHLVGYETEMPVLAELLKNKTKTALRAHSQSAHHLPSIDYFLTFWPTTDLMWEGKRKNADQEIIHARAVRGL